MVKQIGGFFCELSRIDACLVIPRREEDFCGLLRELAARRIDASSDELGNDP